MRYEFLIGLRYLLARRRERFVSVIAFISLAGIAIGTFTLSVALCVMSGFEQDLRARLLAFTPQVTIERSDGGVWNPGDLEKKITAIPGVVAVAPYVTSQVMAVSSTDSGAPGLVSGGILRGVEPHDNGVLKELKDTLEVGSLDDLETTHPVTIVDKGVKRVVQLPGAILGKSLAYELGARPGDPVILISPASLGAGIGPPRLKRFVVTGFFHSGMYDFDSTLVFVALKDGRALLADDASLESGLELRLANMFDAPAIRDKIAAMAGPDFEVKDWTTANAPLFAALKLEKFTYFMVLLLIVLVAAFNIIATLVMQVMERRKEVAILRTMGCDGDVDRADISVARRGGGRDRHDYRRWNRVRDVVPDRQVSFDSSAGRHVHGEQCAGGVESMELRAGGGGDNSVVHAGVGLPGVAGSTAAAGRGDPL